MLDVKGREPAEFGMLIRRMSGRGAVAAARPGETLNAMETALMAFLTYLMIRLVAISLGLGCTVWSAYQSWQHNPWDFTGPLAAVSAAALFVFCERAARDRHWHHFWALGVLGVLAALLSGATVLARNAHSQAERVQVAQTTNLPRTEAERALTDAKAELAKAAAEASAECKSGEGLRCKSLTKREAEARQRVNEARSKLVKLGAATAETPVTAVLGDYAGAFDRAMAVAPALWLELAAPALLAFGFAPWSRKEPVEQKKKAKQRKAKRAKPRQKPAASDQVIPWVEEFRKRNGRSPKIPEVRAVFDLPRTTAWRRIRSV